MSEAAVWVVISVVIFVCILVGIVLSCIGTDCLNFFPNLFRGPLCDCWGCCGRPEEPPEDWKTRPRGPALPPINIFTSGRDQQKGDEEQSDDDDEKVPPPRVAPREAAARRGPPLVFTAVLEEAEAAEKRWGGREREII